MIPGVFPGVTALWLGILTSISPCPLASNIAAVCYVAGGQGKAKGKKAAIGGLFYTLGRMLAYTSVAGVLAWEALSVPAVAEFLQSHMNQVLGPLLFAVGAVILGWIRFPAFGVSVGKGVEKWADKGGVLGAGIIGFLFALSFCPVSAALFFGSLLPLTLSHGSPLLLPMLYGLGTALPVAAVALALAVGFDVAGRFFAMTQAIDRWGRRLTGAVFLAVGIYYSWHFILVPLRA